MKNNFLLSIITIILICLSPIINANDTIFGIGIEINSDLKIYFPIKTSNLLIEPSIAVEDQKLSSTSNTSSSTFETKDIELSIGLFKNTEQSDKTYFYYGARLGYIKTERKTIATTTLLVVKESGYTIAPTIGIEHYLTKGLSIGLETALKYSDTDGDTIATSSTNTSRRAYDTVAAVIARYKF